MRQMWQICTLVRVKQQMHFLCFVYFLDRPNKCRVSLISLVSPPLTMYFKCSLKPNITPQKNASLHSSSILPMIKSENACLTWVLSHLMNRATYGTWRQPLSGGKTCWRHWWPVIYLQTVRKTSPYPPEIFFEFFVAPSIKTLALEFFQRCIWQNCRSIVTPFNYIHSVAINALFMYTDFYSVRYYENISIHLWVHLCLSIQQFQLYAPPAHYFQTLACLSSTINM